MASDVVGVYTKRAGHYDLTANLYYLIGLREWAYRRRAIRALKLRPGDTVIEIGCGTGLNFPLLVNAVGPQGTVIGVDITPAMLVGARHRVARHRWTNVELVHSDAAVYQFPTAVDGILSTFALSLVPDCGRIVERGAAALRPGKRLVVLDLKQPAYWPDRLIPLLLPLVRPFAVTEKVIAARPWQSIRQAMKSSLTNASWEEFFAGFIFIATGER